MRINLLPEEYRPQPAVRPVRLAIMIVGAVLCFATVVFVAFEMIALQGNKAIYEQTQIERASYDSLKAKLDEIDVLAAKVGVYRQELQQINGEYNDYLPIFSDIGAALPDSIWLTDVGISGKTEVATKGGSLDFALVGNYMDNLLKQASIDACKLERITEVETEGFTFYKFEMTLIVREAK